ncbi:Pyridoxamine 5'-phosphate oxidase [Filimonas lacunae]|uniref:Pyridoxine/pyridoxamine 5'-phosphate oxidase n=1 Tax=Filimonas lacunae TaxID=477680 RepID=A0A173MR96_9BACT|nr:pyridoxamine 5'-phosphate oxidase [Filimonas lacunae]BAV09970.1 pyridoxamine 6'-phosphate oxidase [Filimonas lacunae]SIS81878.1 Pyridoxamine 5'-phosphate oxidase [Filimonas lacunae]
MSIQKAIADIRTDYSLKTLDEKEVAKDPITQFDAWWKEAIDSHLDEVNAMTLATASPDGIPSARIVLLKSFDENGFVFFTNYNSAKGRELAANPRAELVFFWRELQRQVRINGIVKKVSKEDSDAYFQSRPAGSRIGALSSPQSQVLANREVLEQIVAVNTAQFAGDAFIPRPGHWGGYVVQPVMIEFWQGRSSRLHDRIQYALLDNNSWKIERLAP